ncbi:hypothetical protein BVY04_01045 [bacterium M21]|nr:hypothetical protein BVY04_01045 [bacterium M21]
MSLCIEEPIHGPRLLLLVDCYLPSRKSAAKLIHDLAIGFSDVGSKVTVLTPDPAITDKVEISIESGVEVVRVRTGRLKGVSKVRRAINEVRLSASLWYGAKAYLARNSFDYVVYYSPTIFFGGLVERLKKLWGCKSYLILRDIFPQWAIDAGVIKSGMIASFFRRFEIRQYQAADVIGVQTPANLAYFEDKPWAANYKLEVLYNWSKTAHDDYASTNFRASLGLEGKVIFFYGGNIGVAQDMDNILRLAARMAVHDDLHFLLVGAGSEVPRLKKIIRDRKVKNITIHDTVSQEEYLGMLDEFDVGILTLDKELKTQNFPGKILGYMAAGMPILASHNPGNDICELLHAKEGGLASVNGNDELLIKHASMLRDDAELRERLGKNGRGLLHELFDVETTAGQILTSLKGASL